MSLNERPVVAPAAGKFEKRGTPPVVVVAPVDDVEEMEPRLLVPFGFEPLSAAPEPLPQLNPSWKPRSLLNDRVAETTRTSISTS